MRKYSLPGYVDRIYIANIFASRALRVNNVFLQRCFLRVFSEPENNKRQKIIVDRGRKAAVGRKCHFTMVEENVEINQSEMA